MSELKKMLLSAPDSQLDASMFPLIEKWDDPPKAIQVLEVVDHCIHGGLASGFALHALQLILDAAIDTEGTTHAELVTRATWRTQH